MVSNVRLGVIGHPIGQSLSPMLHPVWMAKQGIDGTYEKIDGGDLGFSQTVQACIDAGFRGLNVTIPYKADALGIADTVSSRASRIGAANLLIFRNGEIQADNTDTEGFAEAVRHSGWGRTPHIARVLGAGGAAPAVVDALFTLGVNRVEICNRTRSKCHLLKDRFDSVSIIDWEDRDQGLADVELVVNTTSLGMKGNAPLALELADLPAHAAVFDIVTTPLQTDLLKAAQSRNLFSQNGLPMLVYQAIPSFQAWFGNPPDVDVAANVARLTKHLSGTA